MSEPKNKFFSDGWGCRHTLGILGFFGFVMAYVMRFNLSIAIVQMVEQSDEKVVTVTESWNRSLAVSEMCPRHLEITANETLILKSLGYTDVTVTERTIKKNKTVKMRDTKFKWTEAEQGLILGSFFWGYIVTQYPGGKLAHMYGAKWIFSVGLFLTGILSMLLPSVTIMWGKNGLLAIRILMGLTEGVIFPASHVLIAQWSPPEERSRMTNLMFSGIPLGSALSMVSGGYLIHFLGWPSLFYAAGICTFIWFGFWACLIVDHPSEHPTISEKELKAIEESMSGQTQKEYIPTPWKAIATCPAVIVIFIVHIGHTWGHYLLHSEVPKYLHSVHGLNIENNGWFSALPQLLNFGVCIVMSNLSDFLIVKKITSTVFTRKLCGTVALWGSAAAFVGMILGGCDSTIAVSCLLITGACLGAGFGAWIVNLIDIAPNHAGCVMGVANTVSNCLGFISPYVTGLILHANPTLTGWKIAFLIPALINFSVNLLYIIFAKTDEMSWNRRPSTPPLSP